MRGQRSVAGEHRVKGCGNAAWSKEGALSPTSDPVSALRGAVAKNRHVERREGERAFAKARGHLSQEVPLFRAVSALRSLI